MDIFGGMTIFVDSFCRYKPSIISHDMLLLFSQLICTCLSSSTCPLLVETAKPEEREEEETEREESVTAAIKYINSEINTKLKGFDPTKQVKADALIWLVETKDNETIIQFILFLAS